MIATAAGIRWDTDEADLPTQLTFEVEGETDEERREDFMDKASDFTGWCVYSMGAFVVEAYKL